MVKTGEVKLSLWLIKCHAMKVYEAVECTFHTFFIMALDRKINVGDLIF
jgi:hypothetical protein